MVAIGQGNPRMLEASRETVTPADHSVMFIRQVVMMDRVLCEWKFQGPSTIDTYPRAAQWYMRPREGLAVLVIYML
jgi:hypothetical protein